jgi:VanZ family protein
MTQILDSRARYGILLRRLLFRSLFLTALTGLAIGSLMPVHGMAGPSVNDKMMHFVAYAFVGTLAILAFRQMRTRIRCLILLTLLGVALEAGQLFVPGRAFELWDMAANGCGAIVAFTTQRVFPAA